MDGDHVSINILEAVAAVVNVYLMLRGRGERPKRGGGAVLIRADNSSKVSWVMKSRRGRGDELAGEMVGALMRIRGVLEAEGGL